MKPRVFVSLGSNLDDPPARIEAAFGALGALSQTRLERRSPLYSNAALGGGAQPEFVNAVAELATALDPFALLGALQEIEAAQGRERDHRKWAPRVMDLDVLLYGDREIRDDRLTVPHPEMHRRRFVLKPLWDIAPEIEIPGKGPLRGLLDRAPPHELVEVTPGRRAAGVS